MPHELSITEAGGISINTEPSRMETSLGVHGNKLKRAGSELSMISSKMSLLGKFCQLAITSPCIFTARNSCSIYMLLLTSYAAKEDASSGTIAKRNPYRSGEANFKLL